MTEGLKAHPHLDTFLKTSVVTVRDVTYEKKNQSWMLNGVPVWKLSLPG